MKVEETKVFQFISESCEYPNVEIKKNDIIKIEYNSFGDIKKTIKGRFVDLTYASFSKNSNEELKLNEVVLLDTSKEFFAQEDSIPLCDIIYIEKI